MKMKTCRKCKGRGTLPCQRFGGALVSFECPTCKGTGYIRVKKRKGGT